MKFVKLTGLTLSALSALGVAGHQIGASPQLLIPKEQGVDKVMDLSYDDSEDEDEDEEDAEELSLPYTSFNNKRRELAQKKKAGQNANITIKVDLDKTLDKYLVTSGEKRDPNAPPPPVGEIIGGGILTIIMVCGWCYCFQRARLMWWLNSCLCCWQCLCCLCICFYKCYKNRQPEPEE